MAHDAGMSRRRRGEGSVYESGGFYEARLSLGYVTVNGKRRRNVLRVRRKSEADAWAALDRMRRDHLVGVDPTRQTLDQYLQAWLHDHGPSVRPSTLTSYTGHVELHISPLLGGILAAKLRPADVRRLISDRLAAGRSPATVGRIVTTLRMALAQGVRDRVLATNAADVRLPRVEPKPVPALSEDEAERIMDAVAGSWLEPIVTLLLGTGMRLGEACGLDWGDVDLERRFVLVRVSKTKVRAVPMSDTATEALRKHRAAAKRYGPAEPVFLGPRTKDRLSGASVSHGFPELLAAKGLTRMSPHGLRHGAASLMVAKGVHMRVVAEQLGHANPAMTARVYAHVLPEAQQDAVRVLNRKERA